MVARMSESIAMLEHVENVVCGLVTDCVMCRHGREKGICVGGCFYCQTVFDGSIWLCVDRRRAE
jgi:hypothetical protein